MTTENVPPLDVEIEEEFVQAEWPTTNRGGFTVRYQASFERDGAALELCDVRHRPSAIDTWTRDGARRDDVPPEVVTYLKGHGFTVKGVSER